MFFQSHINFQFNDFSMIGPYNNTDYHPMSELADNPQKISVVIISTKAAFSREEYPGRVFSIPIVPYSFITLLPG